VPDDVQFVVYEFGCKIISAPLTSARTLQGLPLSSPLAGIPKDCAVVGCIFAGRPVNVKEVAFDVPSNTGINRVTTLLFKYHVEVAVGFDVNPVPVIVKVPVVPPFVAVVAVVAFPPIFNPAAVPVQFVKIPLVGVPRAPPFWTTSVPITRPRAVRASAALPVDPSSPVT
jgi:hypothetical protein